MAPQMVTVEFANEYFTGHLYADAWFRADGSRRQAALIHAERDIKMLNYPRHGGGPPLVELRAAICEQALFLLERTSGDRERIRAQEIGVSFRWVGDAREDYKGKIEPVAPEAMRILRRYIRIKTGQIR